MLHFSPWYLERPPDRRYRWMRWVAELSTHRHTCTAEVLYEIYRVVCPRGCIGEAPELTSHGAVMSLVVHRQGSPNVLVTNYS